MKKANQQMHEESGNKKRLLSSGAATIKIATTAAHNMKTRDLPNLSECQACGFRIDSCTSGKTSTSIQILSSEWRIVLLCHKCLFRVQSSQVCSYCFDQITEDFFRCCQCKRCVHTKCFSFSKSFPPWSYSASSSSASQFSVCVDCWVPKSIIRRRAFFRAKKSSNCCPDSYNSNSRVLEANCGGGHREMVERKVVVVKKKAITKLSDEGCGNANKEVVDDDAEVAFQLHRVINSSSRISKNFPSVKSTCSSVPKLLEYNEDLTVGVLDSRNSGVDVSFEVYNKSNENPVENGDVEVPLKEGEGSCSDKLVKSSGDENSMNVDSISCQIDPYQSTMFKFESSNGKGDRYLLKYRKRNSSVTGVSDDKSKTLYQKISWQSDMLVNRFLFKYRRRNSKATGTSYGKRKSFCERVSCQNETLDYRYLFKYRKRKTSSKAVPIHNSKAHRQRLSCQSEDFAAEFLLTCSGESRAFSVSSLQSSASPLQASTSASCSSVGKKFTGIR